MTQFVGQPFTYKEYLALPDDGNRYEIIEGILYASPIPTFKHQSIASELIFLLGLHVKKTKLGRVYFAPLEVHLSEISRPLIPDIIFVRTENVPPYDSPYFSGAPDLVVEILAPETIKADLVVKFNLYEKYGVLEYWIVDPKTRSIQVFALEQGQYVLHGQYVENEIITSRVLAGLEIVNSKIFE